MRELFTEHWLFHKFPVGTGYKEAASSAELFRETKLPHDWAIGDVAAFYADASGWYRKSFSCDKKKDLCYILRFEGVYMDSEVYVNGVKVMEWKYGYSTFEADMTDALVSGENEIMVGVHFRNPNSRWYSGAGIYRNVWLLTLPRTHFVSDGIYISARETAEGYQVSVEAEAVCAELCGAEKTARTDKGQADLSTGGAGSGQLMLTCILDGEERTAPFAADETCAADAADHAGAENTRLTARLSFLLKDARVWDLNDPYLYEMTCRLVRGGELLQEEEQKFGCRTVEVDPQKGLFFNHKYLKLNGVCMHHDLGALGAAVNRDATRRQLRIMKEMGVNAIRTSHNMPSVELMELADEMGLLVDSEAFDMWECPKTEYDYARFFNEWYQRDVASWVRRDRNHPSVLFWSIGNEIYDMHAGERGQEITRMLQKEVLRHDPNRNALVTFGSNYMPWENAQKCAEIIKLPGYNYSERFYDEHHAKHPDWVIYGSETASTVQSRGIYRFPLSQSVLADVDEQCSSLGNCSTSWGAKNSEACVIAERDHPYSLGQFLWSGFDYIGEPTPYHTKNSYFGQTDTAGFPKDTYYIYQAEWTDHREKPMVHLFPYWDFNEGQTLDVRICSNAPKAELFVNGRSQGMKALDHAHGERLTADYIVPYEKGEITAVAYNEQGEEIARESRHSFGDSAEVTVLCRDPDGRSIPLTCESAESVARDGAESVMRGGADADAAHDGKADCGIYRIPAGNGRLIFMEIGMKDRDGYPVENANDRVSVRVEAGGRLLGLDNGDSTDYESYQAQGRRLFSGKLLAILEPTASDGEIAVRIERQTKDMWVRKIELIRTDKGELDKERSESQVTVRVFPPEAVRRELAFEITNLTGIVSNTAEIIEREPVTERELAEGIVAKLCIRAKGDGDFRLRATAANGAPQVRVISVLEYSAKGIGTVYFDPYELVTGGLYNDCIGEVGNGNDFGVSSMRDGLTAIGFKGVDFGEVGSDVITLPIFELENRKVPIGIWLGKPGEEGSRLIDTAVYEKPSIWNTYQEQTFVLPERLKGICDLYFELHQKIHLKGFVFRKYEKAYEKLEAKDSRSIYGDSLRVTPDGIMDIGNNVTVEFDDMDFGEDGAAYVRICGRTPNETNTIHIRFACGDEESRQVVEFARSGEFTEQEFAIDPVFGKNKVSFVFMPGCRFDFKWFRFGKEKRE